MTHCWGLELGPLTVGLQTLKASQSPKNPQPNKPTNSAPIGPGLLDQKKEGSDPLSPAYILAVQLIWHTYTRATTQVKVVIVGLGAGLLPMFLHECLPFLQIEVVELDAVVVDLAKKHFGFIEDQRMKVHIGDGVKYVFQSNERDNNISKDPLDGVTNRKEIRIIVIDADSSDLSSGLTCPHPSFVEEVFLKSAKEFLSQGGLFVTNLVSRSTAMRETVISRMNEVFDQLFSLQLEEEVNEVLFACTNKTKMETINFKKLEKLMEFPLEDIEASLPNRIQRLK